MRAVMVGLLQSIYTRNYQVDSVSTQVAIKKMQKACNSKRVAGLRFETR